MMTAVLTGSWPLATLLCNSAERSIVNGLRETARRCRDTGLHVRMYVFGRVRHVETSASPAAPLLYFRGSYA